MNSAGEPSTVRPLALKTGVTAKVSGILWRTHGTESERPSGAAISSLFFVQRYPTAPGAKAVSSAVPSHGTSAAPDAGSSTLNGAVLPPWSKPAPPTVKSVAPPAALAWKVLPITS